MEAHVGVEERESVGEEGEDEDEGKTLLVVDEEEEEACVGSG